MEAKPGRQCVTDFIHAPPNFELLVSTVEQLDELAELRGLCSIEVRSPTPQHRLGVRLYRMLVSSWALSSRACNSTTLTIARTS